MSKSLGNAIFLNDDEQTVGEKVRGMFTDPRRLRARDPGHVEGNPVFVCHDAFNPSVEEVDELKERYRRGVVGDVEVKERLAIAPNRFLGPLRDRRAKYERHMRLVRRPWLTGPSGGARLPGRRCNWFATPSILLSEQISRGHAVQAAAAPKMLPVPAPRHSQDSTRSQAQQSFSHAADQGAFGMAAVGANDDEIGRLSRGDLRDHAGRVTRLDQRFGGESPRRRHGDSSLELMLGETPLFLTPLVELPDSRRAGRRHCDVQEKEFGAMDLRQFHRDAPSLIRGWRKVGRGHDQSEHRCLSLVPTCRSTTV